MANNLGDFDTSAVIYGKFISCRADTGAPATLTSGALSVYKDNSTTQSTTGVTFTGDFDSVTGLNHFTIDTSTDGTFYAAGSFFDIVVTTGTVNSVSAVGSCVGQFTLRKVSALKPTTAGRTALIDSSGRISITDNLTKNTALSGFEFVMTNSTTHVPQTGLTVTAQRSLDGAALASCTNAVSELSNGIYVINLSAADLNGNNVILRFSATAADDLEIPLITQP